MMHTQLIPLRSVAVLCGLGLIGLVTGCDTTGSTSAPAMKPAQVRALNMSGHTDPTDQDRIALSRFVGAWDFAGWYDPPGEARREAKGMAAGTVDHDHFLLLETAHIVAQGNEREFTVGSMLLSSEPGVGLMLTAWSEEAPSVNRFRGTVEAQGSRFAFREIKPVRGNDRLRMVMRFETDDRWVAEFYRKSGGDDVKAASYTFTRSM